MLQSFKHFIIIVILFFSQTLSLSAQNCDELVEYRDEKLWEIHKRATEKYSFNKQEKEDILKHKIDLLEYRGWNELMSTQVSISAKGQIISVIAGMVKAHCTLIKNLLKMSPVTKGPVTAFEVSSITSNKILKALEAGENIHSIVSEDLFKTAMKQALESGNDLAIGVKTTWDYAEDIHKTVNLPGEAEELKATVTRMLNMLDNMVSTYDSNLKTSAKRIKELNEIQVGITEYINEHCPNKPKDLSIKKLVNKEVITQNPTNVGKKTSVNKTGDYYLFLTADLLINSKPISVISQPIGFDGNTNAILALEKAEFINQLDVQILQSTEFGVTKNQFNDMASTIGRMMSSEKQFPNTNEREKIINSLKDNNYHKVQVHYGKPYQNKLLKTKEDCDIAIESFKTTEMEMLKGITSPKFIHLK